MPTRRPILCAVLLATIALVAGLAAYLTMRSGVGLTNDSRSYLSMLEGLRARVGSVPLDDADVLTRRFPPLFPALLLAGDIATGIGPQRVARLMDVACLMLSTILVAAVVWDARRSAARSLFAAALFATASDALDAHVQLWSEPTFVVWMLLGTLTLGRYLRGDGSRGWLIATAALAAAAILTRYAGAALVAAQALAILFRSPRRSRRERVADAVMYGLVPSVALLIWSLAIPQAGVGQRDVAVAWVGWPRLDQAWQTLGSWIAWLGPTPGVARASGAIVIASYAALLVRRRRAMTPTLAGPWMFLCVYPPFLLASITFADPATPLDLRILLPLHLTAILVACGTLGVGVGVVDGVGDGTGVGATRSWRVVAGVLLVAQLASTAHYLGEVRQSGMGYASARWREQQTIRFAATLPKDVPIFTTHRVAVEFLAEVEAHDAPYWTGATPPRSFDAAALPMLESVRAAGGRGYVVLLKRPKSTTKQFLSPGELGRYVKLQRVADLPDGRVYKIVSIVADVRPTPTTVPAAPRDEADESPSMPDAN